MRSRVAFVATLIALIVFALIFIYTCSGIVSEKNDDIHMHLEQLCRFAGQVSSVDDMEERAASLRTVSVEKGMIYALYSADGTAMYVSDERNETLSEQDIAKARKNTVTVYEHANAMGKTTCYAIYQYEDGAFLLFSMALFDFMSLLAANHALLVFAVVFSLCMVFFIITLAGIQSKERRVNQVMETLDQFSDGNFDARIPPVFSEKDPQLAEYNAIISRIQDRIFKQKNRNQVLNTVMSQMQNGIIAVNQDMKVIYVTSVAKKLIGIVGNPEGLSINETSKDVKLEEVFAEAMRQGGVYTNEVAARTAMGRGHRPLRLYVSPMQEAGRVVGALAIVEDITELRRLEQVRTDFAANVSHELKTPLTSIRGFVETLQAGAIDNPEMAHKFLNIIIVETERLTRLINDILSISKLESGDDEVTTERIRLDKKAFDICEMLMIHAGEKQVTINCRLNDEPVYIMGNPDRVEQMLINLTENAIKYNVPGGSVTVQVFSNGKEANVTISDTGIGIAEENLPRLFERFYRVDKGRSRQMGGTGLGLAIVKHIVRSMNGEIEVHSKLGEGTEFLITLPLAPKKNPEKDTIFNEE